MSHSETAKGRSEAVEFVWLRNTGPAHEIPLYDSQMSQSLSTLFDQAGLKDVAVQPLDVPTRFSDFDDYWSPFLGGQYPAPDYAMSLSEDDRVQLREHIRGKLPINVDGSIDLIARAWGVQGTR